MLNFNSLLKYWGTPEFDSQFKKEVGNLTVKELPLQKGLSVSSIALDTTLKVLVLKKEEEEGILKVKAGVFYTGVIAGCNCTDDPSPMDEQSEYCEIEVSINKLRGDAKVILISS